MIRLGLLYLPTPYALALCLRIYTAALGVQTVTNACPAPYHLPAPGWMVTCRCHVRHYRNMPLTPAQPYYPFLPSGGTDCALPPYPARGGGFCHLALFCRSACLKHYTNAFLLLLNRFTCLMMNYGWLDVVPFSAPTAAFPLPLFGQLVLPPR